MKLNLTLTMNWNNTEQTLLEIGKLSTEQARQFTSSPVSYTVDNLKLTIDLPGYYNYIVRGRGPGKMPPKLAIDNWIEVKHIVPRLDTTVAQLSYLIRRKISRFGTDGKPEADLNLTQYRDKLYQAVLKDLQIGLIFNVK